MDLNKIGSGKLFNLSVVDQRDELDEKCDRSAQLLAGLLKTATSEAEVHDTLNQFVCKSPAAHEDACYGLLMAILCDQQNAPRYYRDLNFINRDGHTSVLNALNQLVIEKYHKLVDNSRTQIIWLVNQMIRSNVAAVETVIFNLFRQIPGGDISNRSLWLAEKLLTLLKEHRAWLDKNPVLIATAVYTYLRLIVDHFGPHLKELRQQETEFTVLLLRERFAECKMIGRDLIRLLQNVARIPEFEQFWHDLHNNPASLCPNFAGIVELMQTRTSRRFLQCRLTPEMERKLCFLTSFVRLGQQKRYQEWFQRQYLSTAESQSLRCDLIRFICGVIHPSNEVLCSDIIPRWAIIGWILSTCTSNVAASNAKLSLFYDWLFFDPERDNIMNIEPAILVIFHSFRSHPVISVSLLDFLCRIVQNFHPSLATNVRQGICSALHQILQKRVLPSLQPVFENEKLDRDLRSLIRSTFPEFCSQQLNEPPIALTPNEIVDISDALNDGPLLNNNNSRNHLGEFEAKFSDDEGDESRLSPKKLNNNNSKPVLSRRSSQKSETRLQYDFTDHIETFSGALRTDLEELHTEKDSEQRCEIMERIVQHVIQSDMETEALASMLNYLLHDDLMRNIFPESLEDEALEDSIGSPLFVIFRNLCEISEDNPSRGPLLMLLSDMAAEQKCIGYLLLYYIKVSRTEDVSVYKELAKSNSKDLSASLLDDLQYCLDDDVNMMCYIVPDVYRDFENQVISNAKFLHLVVSAVDAAQLQELICFVLQGEIKMLKKESIVALINASLEWETFEQFCFWQLIAAHSIAIENIMPVLPKLEFTAHSEALTNILLILKRLEPTPELLRHILGRNAKAGDTFVVSILKTWLRNHDKKLAELISTHLNKSIASPAKRGKRTNNSKNSLSTSGEQILAHLDELRQQSKSSPFFNSDNIQTSITNVQTVCTDAQKARFSDLFALASDFDTKPAAKRGKNSKNAKNKSKVVEDSTDTEASEEEEQIAAKPSKQGSARKKRKTAHLSDSD